MKIDLSDEEIAALAWALSLVSSEIVEEPGKFGPGTEELQNRVRLLSHHFSAVLFDQRNEDPRLYEVAKQVCHEAGIPWTDPRTGKTYLPPKI